MYRLFNTRQSILQRAWLAAVSVLALSSCGGGQQAYDQTPAVDVDYMVIQPSVARIEKKYPGAVEGTVNVDIKAQVIGYLENIYVNEGDYVKKGQSLFRIKGDVYHEQVNNSQAALSAARSAEETARIELEKIRPLVAGKVVSEMQLQTAEANYASARAQVAQAKAALGSSRINEDFSLIKAPVNGYIGRIPNRIGNLVTPNDAMPLTNLSEINDVFVYFSLSEADFISFVRDRKSDEGLNHAELILADGSAYSHPGKLEIASGNIDRPTGSIALKAIFPNPDQILRSGGSAKVVLTRTLPAAIKVPMASVRDIQNKYFVFALTDSNTVAMKAIELAGRDGSNYIVRDGINTGERIIVNRIDALNEGMPVSPSQPADTTRNKVRG